MTTIKHPKTTAALFVMGAIVAFATIAGPASARWYGNEGYNNGWHGNDHYNGYNYRAPPVIYNAPYNNGYYYPPPVIYDNNPGVSIRLF